jgi:hypothetical protein
VKRQIKLDDLLDDVIVEVSSHGQDFAFDSRGWPAPVMILLCF